MCHGAGILRRSLREAHAHSRLLPVVTVLPRVCVFVLSLLVGLLMLVLGAELLVRGGGQLALALRVPALVVGLTIVAFGTSTPELMVSLTAATNASTDMALANVNGSNFANVTLVLGLAALVTPLAVERSLLSREIPVCLGLQALVPIMCWDGKLGQIDGAILLLAGIGYNAWLLTEAMRGRIPPDPDMPEQEEGFVKHSLFLLGGLAVLIVGAQLFVEGAVEVAKALHLSDRFIGLSVVALGTSAPEVATGMVSAYRDEADLAVGNSLGSNLLNIAMVLGLTSMVFPIRLSGNHVELIDMGVAFAVTLLLVPFVRKGSISRFEGGLLASGYVAYLLFGYYFGPDATLP